MIMLGGATRLTHSGLSIVEWKPITGIIPPLTESAWLEEFAKYQQSPEYQLVNFGMSLSEFKFIFFMEYAHRLLGRFMGLWFAIPLIYFWMRQKLPTFLKKNAVLALVLGFCQGFMGWYMVKSGLVKDPSVSHYRLTIHLLLAIAIMGILLWSAFRLMTIDRGYIKETFSIKKLAHISIGLVMLTITYGGLVAGLKAGLIYNTYPLMEGHFLPSEWLFIQPTILNFIENPATVQFIHRWLAAVAFGIAFYTGILAFKSAKPDLRFAGFLLAGAATLQFILGILTLLLTVPVSLGTLHQGNAIVLFALNLWVMWLTKERSVREIQ
jgi:cytochrome c oxidase assembly protein subunit 15